MLPNAGEEEPITRLLLAARNYADEQGALFKDGKYPAHKYPPVPPQEYPVDFPASPRKRYCVTGVGLKRQSSETTVPPILPEIPCKSDNS